MWNHIINIHSSELLSTKIEESRIYESQKKKKEKEKCFTIILKNGQFTFYTYEYPYKFF